MRKKRRKTLQTLFLSLFLVGCSSGVEEQILPPEPVGGDEVPDDDFVVQLDVTMPPLVNANATRSTALKVML